MGVTIFYRIFLTFRLIDRILCRILSIPQNIAMGLDKAMMLLIYIVIDITFCFVFGSVHGRFLGPISRFPSVFPSPTCYMWTPYGFSLLSWGIFYKLF